MVIMKNATTVINLEFCSSPKCDEYFFTVPQLGMKLDEMKKHFELLEPFYYRVLWLREIYFEEHNKNPGLFAGVVSFSVVNFH